MHQQSGTGFFTSQSKKVRNSLSKKKKNNHKQNPKETSEALFEPQKSRLGLTSMTLKILTICTCLNDDLSYDQQRSAEHKTAPDFSKGALAVIYKNASEAKAFNP